MSRPTNDRHFIVSASAISAESRRLPPKEDRPRRVPAFLIAADYRRPNGCAGSDDRVTHTALVKSEPLAFTFVARAKPQFRTRFDLWQEPPILAHADFNSTIIGDSVC
jgi:hypothetical protein